MNSDLTKLSYYYIEIDGIDKTGKDTLWHYIDYMSGRKYVINSRGIISQVAYSCLYDRKYTYMPTSEVIALMNMDENIVAEARAALASLYAKQGVTEIRGQINTIRNQYGEAESNIEAGIQAQIEAAQKARKDYLSGLEGY